MRKSSIKTRLVLAVTYPSTGSGHRLLPRIAVPSSIARQNDANPTRSFELEIFAIDGKKTRETRSGVPRKGKNNSGRSREENLRIALSRG
ncbi:hypothetical protein ARMSODRAFT_961702 [Armillaria solidipes]|uniref:Uncharacterized protein n=1 Tax=Armillaria solidipes TaxID=1076256 RepID=A0A2H3B1R3_9AGAR|nr:hypothetical protein ARMSODRAFT_961702 [Armillaria solidipes]